MLPLLPHTLTSLESDHMLIFLPKASLLLPPSGRPGRPRNPALHFLSKHPTLPTAWVSSHFCQERVPARHRRNLPTSSLSKRNRSPPNLIIFSLGFKMTLSTRELPSHLCVLVWC